MKNKFGQGLAVGLTAIASACVVITGLIVGDNNPELYAVMGAPIGVAACILFGDGWSAD
jgi:hypothetical protein